MPATSAVGSSVESAGRPYIAELERSGLGTSRDIQGEAEADDDDDDDDDDADDGGWEDWQEDNGDGESLGATFSLFEPKKRLASPEEALAYDHSKFGVDLIDVVQRLQLDFHQIIRLINWIRRDSPSAESVKSLTQTTAILADDRYMTPVIEDDPLLQLDLEDIALSRQPSTSAVALHSAVSGPDLARRVRGLEEQLVSAQQALLEQRQAIEQHYNSDLLALRSEQAGTDGNRSASPQGKGKQRDDDSHYFQSYSDNEIHEIMLKDAVRTDAYRDFITLNSQLFEDATVLDVGCGSGVLSMFAAKAGAKRVYAVDASDIAYKAMQNVKDNGLSDIIKVVKGKIEDLPEEELDKADIIVSEWMGYFLLYESMVDSVIHARDRFLKPGGLVVPSLCTVVLAAASVPEFWADIIGYWDNVYGFKMTAMAANVHKEAHVGIYKPDCVISTSAPVKHVNVSLDSANDSDFSSSFEISITEPGKTKFHGFLGWFDTFFTTDGRLLSCTASSGDAFALPTLHDNEISFTTGPHGTSTHWKQTLFLLKTPVDVEQGDAIRGRISCRKNPDNSRELEVDIVWRIGKKNSDAAQSWLVR